MVATMSEEIKNDELLDEEPEVNESEENKEIAAPDAVESDEDIDQYIRALTGKEAPKKAALVEEKPVPEVEQFRVTSSIGADDYKAFIYFSTLKRYKWVLPVFILVPVVFSAFFAFAEGQFYPLNFLFSLVLMLVVIFGLIAFRCQRWLSKIKKNSPKVLHLTETTLVFLTNSVVNMKNGNRVKVEYTHMIQACESRKRFIMYFDNGKSMLFRKEDMPIEQQDKFRTFILSKVHKTKLFKKP